MSNCTNKIYKGEDSVLHFYIEDEYSNLEIKVYTDGKTMVTPSEITTEDGLITMYFHNDDLDILADGVLRYDVQYDVDGETVVRSICSDRYLKTPDGYSAMTAEEVYNQGYAAGFEAGESGDCTSAITIAFQSGYTDGHLAGMVEQAIADSNRLTHLSATTNGTYTAPYGYSEVIVDVPASSGTDCNLQVKNVNLTTITKTITADNGYDGLSAVTVSAQAICNNRYNIGFNNGYSSGITEVANKAINLVAYENNQIYFPDFGNNQYYKYVWIRVVNSFYKNADFGIAISGAGYVEIDAPYDPHSDDNFSDIVDSIYTITDEGIPHVYNLDEEDWGKPFYSYYAFSGAGYHIVWFELNDTVGVGNAWFKTSGLTTTAIYTRRSPYINPRAPFYPGVVYDTIDFNDFSGNTRNLIDYIFEH